MRKDLMVFGIFGEMAQQLISQGEPLLAIILVAPVLILLVTIGMAIWELRKW